MTAVIAATPKFFFTSSTGTPLADGTVTVYLAGTTTPSNTWQDQGQGTLNTNPIELDARGSATIWLDSTLTYDFLVKNSAGVTQYTIQDVQGVSAPTLAAVAVDRFSGTGAQTVFTLSTTPNGENSTQVYVGGVYIQKNAYSVAGDQLTFAAAPANGTNNIEVNILTLVDYTSLQAFLDSIDILENLIFEQAGTGAVEREFNTKLRESGVAPEDFGAVGDGVADDTAEFQLALNTGYRVRMPHGKTYKISSSLSVPSGGGIIGDGSQIIYMVKSGGFTNTTLTGASLRATNTVGIKAEDAALAQLTDIVFKDFKIESEVDDTGRYLVGLMARNVDGLLVEGVEAYGFPASRVFQFDTVQNGKARSCWVHDCTTNVDATVYTVTDPLIHAFTLDSSRVSSTPSVGFVFDNCMATDIKFGATAITAFGEQSDGLNLNGAGNDSGTTTSRDHQVINLFVRSAGDGIDMFAKGCVITGGQLIDCYNAGIKMTNGARNNKIIGTHIVRPGIYGISFDSAELPGFTQDIINNDIIGVTVENVNPTNAWATATFAFGARLNGTPTFLPHNNRVLQCRVLGPTTYMHYAVSAQCGTGNIWEVECPHGWEVAQTHVSGASTTATIRTGKPTNIRAYLSSNQTVTAAGTETIEFDTKDYDTNDEFNAIAGVQIASITRSGTTATLTTISAHNRTTADLITLRNAYPNEYNVEDTAITVTGATTFTYPISADPGASASTVGRYVFITENNTYIATAHRKLRVFAQARTTGAASADYTMAIRLNGNVVAERNETKAGAFAMSVETTIDVVPGDQVFARFTNADSADRDLTGASRFTYLTISEV